MPLDPSIPFRAGVDITPALDTFQKGIQQRASLQEMARTNQLRDFQIQEEQRKRSAQETIKTLSQGFGDAINRPEGQKIFVQKLRLAGFPDYADQYAQQFQKQAADAQAQEHTRLANQEAEDKIIHEGIAMSAPFLRSMTPEARRDYLQNHFKTRGLDHYVDEFKDPITNETLDEIEKLGGKQSTPAAGQIQVLTDGTIGRISRDATGSNKITPILNEDGTPAKAYRDPKSGQIIYGKDADGNLVPMILPAGSGTASPIVSKDRAVNPVKPPSDGENQDLADSKDILIPGLSPIPGVRITKKSVESVKQGAQAYDELKSQVAGLRDLYSKHGTQLTGEAARKMASKITQIKLTLKGPEFAQLGVLAGPDMSILEKMVPDPTGWEATGKAMFKGITGDPILPKLDELDAFMEQRFGSALRRNGFQIGSAKPSITEADIDKMSAEELKAFLGNGKK